MIEMELWKVVLVINFFIIMFWKRNKRKLTLSLFKRDHINKEKNEN